MNSETREMVVPDLCSPSTIKDLLAERVPMRDVARSSAHARAVGAALGQLAGALAARSHDASAELHAITSSRLNLTCFEATATLFQECLTNRLHALTIPISAKVCWPRSWLSMTRQWCLRMRVWLSVWN